MIVFSVSFWSINFSKESTSFIHLYPQSYTYVCREWGSDKKAFIIILLLLLLLLLLL